MCAIRHRGERDRACARCRADSTPRSIPAQPPRSLATSPAEYPPPQGVRGSALGAAVLSGGCTTEADPVERERALGSLEVPPPDRNGPGRAVHLDLTGVASAHLRRER